MTVFLDPHVAKKTRKPIYPKSTNHSYDKQQLSGGVANREDNIQTKLNAKYSYCSIRFNGDDM